jgi:predicted nucleotidyltransferase
MEKIKEMLKAHQAELRSFGVTSLAVFGSVARGEATEESDVDFLIEFDEARSIDLFDFIMLNQFLEEKLGAKVDLVTLLALKKQLKDQILKEAVRVA